MCARIRGPSVGQVREGVRQLVGNDGGGGDCCEGVLKRWKCAVGRLFGFCVL